MDFVKNGSNAIYVLFFLNLIFYADVISSNTLISVRNYINIDQLLIKFTGVKDAFIFKNNYFIKLVKSIYTKFNEILIYHYNIQF